MHRLSACIVAIGVFTAWASTPATARAEGVWVTLAAGIAGGSTPTSEGEFWFDSPHGPPLVAVNQYNGGSIIEARTGGGSTFFGGAGTPVMLNLGDGSAYVTGGSAPPDSAKYRGPGGASGTPASTSPTAGGTIPSEAALLGINVSDPSSSPQSLTASVTDSLGNPLGTGNISVPDGGWWVLGLTPGSGTDPGPTDPPPIDPGTGGNGGGDTDPPPTGTPSSPPPLNSGGGSVNTPEPSTMALLAIGGVSLGAVRRFRFRK